MRVAMIPYQPQRESNPYLHLLSEALRERGHEVVPGGWKSRFVPDATRAGRPDVLHLHWTQRYIETPHPLKRLLKRRYFLRQLDALRRRGVGLVYTAHNVLPHELGERAEDHRRTVAGVLRRCDAVVAHCAVALERLSRQVGVSCTEQAVIAPHPHYIDRYGPRVDRAEARRRLGLAPEGLVLLLLGQIRPYKGAEELVRAVQENDERRATLLIAGKISDPDLRRSLEAAAGRDPRVRCDAGFVPDEKIPDYLAACDAMILPFRDMLTSGSAVLAMSYARPVIAPRIGCLPETVPEDAGVLYDPNEDLGGVLDRVAAEAPRLGERGERAYAAAERWSWQHYAQATERAYLAAAGKEPSAA